MAKESRSTAGMGGGHSKSGKKSKKHTHEMRIRHAKSGGYIVSHHNKPKPGEMAEEPEEHVVPDLDQLQAHVADNMAPPDQGQGGGGEAPPPAAAGAGPGPQMGM